jgi:hypothetical protein
MKTLEYYAARTLQEAVHQGVIDTVMTEWPGAMIPAEMFHWVVDQQSREPFNPNQNELYQHPVSQRHQESVFDVQTQPDITEYWAVELARIYVPEGVIGYLVGIDQVLNDVQGNYYPSNVTYWGSPHFVIPDVDNCRWYLRLDYFNGQQPARFNLSSAAPIPTDRLPGFPYSELHEIPGLWYPAHQDHPLKLLIPGQHMLRFYFVSPPTTIYQWQTMGRLRAYTQTTYSRAAQFNAGTFC